MRIGMMHPNYLAFKEKFQVTTIEPEPYKPSPLSENRANQKNEIDSLYGGNKEITRDDALMYQYVRDNPISLFDPEPGVRAHTASQVPQAYIDGLNQETITEWDSVRLRFALDFQGDNLDYNINRLAAAYTAGAEHLTAHFSGEKLEGYLQELEAAVLEKATEMADRYANKVGGFLEENGGSDETEKIYNSIMFEYEQRVQQYSSFAKNNSDYAGLNNSPDQWLKNDVAYMAQELRKAYDAQTQETQTQSLPAEVGSSDRYSLQEITLASRFVDEIKEQDIASWSSNEEQIGLQAGILLLKTELFTQQSGVSDDLGKNVTAAVKTYIERQIELENKWLQEHADDPYFDITKNPDLDKFEIDQVCSRMLQTYEKEKDYLKAILDGIEYAQNRSEQKSNDSYYGTLDRYRYSHYWDQFFDNSGHVSSPVFQQMYVQGMDTRTDFMKLVDSWNDFAFHLTKSQDYALNIGQYCVQG